MVWVKLIADPFSGTNPRAEKGTCKKVESAAKTISATPVNQAAPPPTPGPFNAKTKTFRCSMMERSNSVARDEIRSRE